MMIRSEKKRYAAAGICCVLLCVSAGIAESGIYKKILPDEQDRITIGVFSDSYWEVQNGYSYQILNDAVAKYEEAHPDIKVEYVSGVLKEDYSEWLSERLLSGDAPDVFFVLGDDFNILAESGALKDLSFFIENDDSFQEDMFYSSAFESGKYENISYAIPYECAPRLMFVNRTILESEKIDMPENDWTWEEFYDICSRVTRDTDGDGLLDQFGTVGYTWAEAFESNGVVLFDQTGSTCSFTGQGVGEALEFVERLDELTAGYNVSERDYDLGNVAFRPMSFSEFRAYKSYPLSVKKYSGFEWGCIPMPSGPSGENISTLDTLMIGMNDGTQHAEQAWELIKILTCDPEIQSEIFDYSEGVAVLREVTESERTLQRLIEETGSGQSLNLSILSDAVEKSLISPAFSGADEAMEQVDRAVNDIIEGNGNISMEQIIWNRELNRYLEDSQTRSG